MISGVGEIDIINFKAICVIMTVLRIETISIAISCILLIFLHLATPKGFSSIVKMLVFYAILINYIDSDNIGKGSPLFKHVRFAKVAELQKERSQLRASA